MKYECIMIYKRFVFTMRLIYYATNADYIMFTSFSFVADQSLEVNFHIYFSHQIGSLEVNRFSHQIGIFKGKMI